MSPKLFKVSKLDPKIGLRHLNCHRGFRILNLALQTVIVYTV